MKINFRAVKSNFMMLLLDGSFKFPKVLKSSRQSRKFMTQGLLWTSQQPTL